MLPCGESPKHEGSQKVPETGNNHGKDNHESSLILFNLYL